MGDISLAAKVDKALFGETMQRTSIYHKRQSLRNPYISWQITKAMESIVIENNGFRYLLFLGVVYWAMWFFYWFPDVFWGCSVYVVSMVVDAVALSRCVVPGFSAKMVKTFIYMVPQLEVFRRLYEARVRFKPFSVTPLFAEGGRVLIGSRPHVVDAGSRLWFRLSIAVEDPSILEKIGFSEIEVRPNPSSRFLLGVRELEVVSIDSLSIGLDSFDKVVRIRFLSPALLSTKLMAPPLPHFLKRVERIRERYVLYPSSAHICSYLTKLWNTLFPTKPISRKVSTEWSAYFMGRLCEVAMIPMDYSTKPITVVYDRNRKPRGFIGWALYEIGDIGRKLLKKIDAILALGNYLGIGKSRSIGFGTVSIEAIPRRDLG